MKDKPFRIMTDSEIDDLRRAAIALDRELTSVRDHMEAAKVSGNGDALLLLLPEERRLEKELRTIEHKMSMDFWKRRCVANREKRRRGFFARIFGW